MSTPESQMSLAETIENVAKGSHVLQANVDKAIVALVEDNMLPLQIVDSNSEMALIELFVWYNTAMPSIATAEHLFSLGKDINKAKRSSLSDESLNILMFAKGNMNAKINLK